MKTTIIMINRENLISSNVNHRQKGARKIQGKTWIENLPPLTVADAGNGKYIVLNGNRRLEYLSECQAFPCIVVAWDVSSEESIAAGIEKYKGDSLALSLADVVKFGLDKVKWQVGKYLAKDGESLFLSDMVSLYEDYHPCPIADDGNAETDEGKAIAKKVKGFHKGLNQSIYRACMLGGQYAEDYVNKVKGVSTALRAAMDAARKAQMRGLSWSDSKVEALPAYQAELLKVASKSDKADADMDGIANYISTFTVSLNACEDLSDEAKEFYGQLMIYIVKHDVAGFTQAICERG